MVAKSKMPITDYVAAWMQHAGWEDELNINSENKSSVVSTRFGDGDHSYETYIECYEEPSFLIVYMYASLVIPSGRYDEFCRLTNHINSSLAVGRLSGVAGKEVQYKFGVDLENCEIPMPLLGNMLSSGVRVLNDNMKELGLVLFSDMHTEDVIELREIGKRSKDAEVAQVVIGKRESAPRVEVSDLLTACDELFSKGSSKRDVANFILQRFPKSTRSEILKMFVECARLTSAGASTYYTNLKKSN